jgi:hypothetical protein
MGSIRVLANGLDDCRLILIWLDMGERKVTLKTLAFFMERHPLAVHPIKNAPPRFND